MNKSTNYMAYQRLIELAMEYTENNLDSDLSLQTLSNIAGFSPYHFHRIFHSVTGKNLHEYVLERRLNNCASELLYADCDITTIAINFGFSTASSFSRSFKKHFGCTPTQYKKTKERKYPISFAEIDIQEISFDEQLENHFNEIVLPDLRTICVGVTGISESWENQEINKAYDQIFMWLNENKQFTSNTKICGVTMDSPEVQNFSSCRYYACATVEKYIHDELFAYRVFQTSGKYICCKINRGNNDFAKYFFKRMDYLYGFYMGSHNLIPDNRPFVEFYERMPDGDIYIYFCVPVKNSKK